MVYSSKEVLFRGPKMKLTISINNKSPTTIVEIFRIKFLATLSYNFRVIFLKSKKLMIIPLMKTKDKTTPKKTLTIQMVELRKISLKIKLIIIVQKNPKITEYIQIRLVVMLKMDSSDRRLKKIQINKRVQIN